MFWIQNKHIEIQLNKDIGTAYDIEIFKTVSNFKIKKNLNKSLLLKNQI